MGGGVSADLQLGDHVMAIVVPRGSHGGYSEQVVVPAESVARLPAGATNAESATLPMNGLTARQALDLLSARAIPAGRAAEAHRILEAGGPPGPPDPES